MNIQKFQSSNHRSSPDKDRSRPENKQPCDTNCMQITTRDQLEQFQHDARLKFPLYPFFQVFNTKQKKQLKSLLIY